MKYIIEGGHKLEGKIRISGNKNSVFPCMAAALLTDEEVVLENISDLKDTQVLIQILKRLGVEAKQSDSQIVIAASNIKRFSLPEDLMLKLRGSIVLAGALLGRLNKVNFYHPGGDIIGRRSIETHIEGFKALGAVVKRNDLKYTLTFTQRKQESTDIFLSEASVTATENLVLAAVLGRHIITLRNCAKEPHILDLCQMLVAMGAKIEGLGTDTLKITGVDKLRGTKFSIGADYIEAGTYIVAAAITGGEVKLEGLGEAFLEPAFAPLREFGVTLQNINGDIIVQHSKLKSIPKLVTNIWKRALPGRTGPAT